MVRDDSDAGVDHGGGDVDDGSAEAGRGEGAGVYSTREICTRSHA